MMQRARSPVSVSASERARDPFKQMVRDVRKVREEQKSTTRLLEKIVVPFIRQSGQLQAALENRVLELENLEKARKIREQQQRQRVLQQVRVETGEGRSDNQPPNIMGPGAGQGTRGRGGRNGRPMPHTMTVDGKQRYICGICAKDYSPTYYWKHYNSH